VRITLFSISFYFLFGTFSLLAQNANKPNRLNGTVSYLTSENVYLRFSSTEKLVLNDTIYVVNGKQLYPCLILQQKSSVSCVAQIINGCNVKTGDAVAYFYADEKPVEEADTATIDSVAPVPVVPAVKPTQATKKQEPINGRVSLANYTTLGNGDVNSRTVARLSLNADNIGGSNFSVRTYAHYRQNNISRESENTVDRRLNVYELAVNYAIDETFSISAGRIISRKMPSVGAMDGLMLDKSWNTVYVGAIAGMRPDPFSYKVNFNLFQIGAFAGLYHTKSKSSFTNIGFMNQSNTGLTDRRYLFLQHSSSIGSKLNLFASSEVDLYKTDSLGAAQSGGQLTSVFLSANFRATKRITLSASFDSRRNLILYQSFADQLNSLLAYNPVRNGIRFGFDVRASTNIRTGIYVAMRTQNNQQNEYYMGNFYFNVSNFPWIGGTLNNNLSYNTNSTFNYASLNVRYNRYLFKEAFSFSPYYRLLRHTYATITNYVAYQQYFGLDMQYYITRNLSLGVMYEYSLQKDQPFNRFNVNLIQRF
jgi:hypothetical protein